MAQLSTITSLWQNVREADLRLYRDQALAGVRLAIVGDASAGTTILADQIRRDPNHPSQFSDAPLLLIDLASLQLDHIDHSPDLFILMLPADKADYTRERTLLTLWQNNAKLVMIFINNPEGAPISNPALSPWLDQTSRRVLIGSPANTRFLLDKFAPVVLEALPDKLLALGRNYPLFRQPIARHLISDASLSNATYAFSTGLAEIIPVLNIPFTITDMIVITKSQAFLVYKLGLALGYSTRWQDYAAEFGGVLGGGLIWRQVARYLVGLIPVIGIVPKTVIAYTGTNVIGNVVLQWYLTGRHLSSGQLRQLTTQARLQGAAFAKTLGRQLTLKRSKPKDPQLALPATTTRRVSKRKQVCSKCLKISAPEANFCQHCGTPFFIQDELDITKYPPEV